MLAKRRFTIRALRALASRALHAMAILVLLTGIAQAGSRYFYCPLMQVVLSASCCDHDEKTSDQQELRQTDCCEAKSIRALPAGALAAPPRSFVAPLVAFLPPLELAHTRALVPLRSDRFSYPAKRRPPSSSASRAELMVFVI
jgi:hypothetical protein